MFLQTSKEKQKQTNKQKKNPTTSEIGQRKKKKY